MITVLYDIFDAPGTSTSNIFQRLISDDPIPIGHARRRRVRVLVERGTRIETKKVRDSAIVWATAVEDQHGHQDAIAVMFYDDILNTAGILGSWDRCPGGVWANAVDAPNKPQMWVIIKGVDSDVLLKMQLYLLQQAKRSSSRGVETVDSR